MKVLDVQWFSGRSFVGIVRVESEWDGILYYIGAPPVVTDEETDAQWIADWGSTFPSSIGDMLFGVKV